MIVTAETFIPALLGIMFGLMVIFIASLWVIKRYVLSAPLAILAACAVFIYRLYHMVLQLRSSR